MQSHLDMTFNIAFKRVFRQDSTSMGALLFGCEFINYLLSWGVLFHDYELQWCNVNHTNDRSPIPAPSPLGNKQCTIHNLFYH